MRLKIKYKKWIVLWSILSIVFISLNNCLKFLDETDTALILGCISIGISILSLGYTDMSKKQFTGLIHVKLLEKSIQFAADNQSVFNKLSFHIINLSGYAINNFTVTFRFPDKIYYEQSQNHQHFSYFRYGETVLATSDILKFIGFEPGYNDVYFDHYLNLNIWKKGNVMLTISGDNIEPTTYSFKQEQLAKLKVQKSMQLLKYEVSKQIRP
jgi:hypothetical protein